jgi:hypothetical protein
LQLGVRSNQSYLEDDPDLRSSCSMHPDQQIGRWKVSLILDFSKFLSETFLTFGLYDYVKMMVRKTKQKLELSK